MLDESDRAKKTRAKKKMFSTKGQSLTKGLVFDTIIAKHRIVIASGTKYGLAEYDTFCAEMKAAIE